MANFTNPEGLKQLGAARWSVTGQSGAPTVGGAGEDGIGRIQAAALERANVDITEELVELIRAQGNFQPHHTATETGNQMTPATMNIASKSAVYGKRVAVSVGLGGRCEHKNT